MEGVSQNDATWGKAWMASKRFSPSSFILKTLFSMEEKCYVPCTWLIGKWMMGVWMGKLRGKA